MKLPLATAFMIVLASCGRESVTLEIAVVTGTDMEEEDDPFFQVATLELAVTTDAGGRKTTSLGTGETGLNGAKTITGFSVEETVFVELIGKDGGNEIVSIGSTGTVELGGDEYQKLSVFFSRKGRFTLLPAEASMQTERFHHSTTEAKDGKVVFCGGLKTPEYADPGDVIDTCELFDLRTIEISGSFRMLEGRADHAAVSVGGSVVLAGGMTAQGKTTSSVEVFDIYSHEFKNAGRLRFARTGHTATRLPDGEVLVIGGKNDEGNGVTQIEVFNPQKGESREVGLLERSRVGHAAILAGEYILVTGGNENDDTALVIDRTNFKIVLRPKLEYKRGSVVAALSGSMIVIFGGAVEGSGGEKIVEVFDTVNRTIDENARLTMTAAHDHGTAAVLLPSGKIVIAGGYGTEGPLDAAELLSLDEHSSTPLPPMKRGRVHSASSVLPNGLVLFCGGGSAECEAFNP